MSQFVPAAWWKRVGAGIIDVSIVYLVTAILTIFWHHLIAKPLPSPDALQLMDVVRVMSIFLATGWLYFTVAESGPRQGSLGKRIWGIKVTDLEGRRLTFAQASRRFWLKMCSIICPSLSLCKRRIFHDALSATSVVNKKVGAATALPAISKPLS